LVPVDFSSASEGVIAYARALAVPGDELLLLHVIPTPDFTESGAGPAADRWETQRLTCQAAEEALRDFAARVVWPAPDRVSRHVGQGEAAAEIVLQALALDAAMIVMATQGRGAAGRLAFGSVADQVARHAPVPVLLVRASPGVELKRPARVARIVVPVDGSPTSLEAIPTAAGLAQQFGVPLELVTVREVNRTVMPSPAMPFLIDDGGRDTADDELADLLRQTSAPLQAAGIETSGQVLSGPVAPTITEQLEPYDLVVMTSHGRRGVPRWLLGSVAEHLVRTAPAPVLLVPPQERALSALAGGTHADAT
jgi:nucleotide-binding universal stress UspA family protein